MNDLRTSLHDVADHVPRVDVPAHDLWQQGRAVRRGERATALAAVVVLVLLVAGVGAVVKPVTGVMPAAAPEVPDGGALPTTVHVPTYPAGDWSAGDDGLEDDQTFGPVSVAWARGSLAPLLVGATDGQHHLPDLPYTWDSTPMSESVVALSPDGMQLAYDWRTLGAQTVQTRAGIAVLDLRTGRVEKYDARGGNDRPVAVDEISWSADGSHVAWLGDEAVQWDRGATSFKGQVLEAGVVRVSDGRIQSWTVEKGAKRHSAVTVSGEGEVYVLARRTLWTSALERMPLGRSADLVGRTVVDSSTHWTTATERDGTLYAGNDEGLVALDLRADEPVAERVKWRGVKGPDWIEPVGTTRSGAVVAVVRHDDLTAVESRIERLRDGRVDILTKLPGSAFQPVGVATWLADVDPVDFPAPSWPMSDELKVFLVMLGVSALGVAAWLGYLALRRRRPTGVVVTRRTVAVLLLVGLVVGVGVGVRALRTPDVPDGGALPTEVHRPKGGASVETNLAFGRLSVAQGHDWSAPVLVGASDGVHHLAGLPDLRSKDEIVDQHAMLSPDGRMLAYAWRSTDGDGSRSAGIALLDVRTGEVQQYGLRGADDRPLLLDRISWSADGSHVAWIGDEAGWWDRAGSLDDEDFHAGVLRVGNGSKLRTWTARSRYGVSAVAVSDDGDLFVLGHRRLWTTLGAGGDGSTLVSRRVIDEHTNWSSAVVRDGRVWAGDQDRGEFFSIDARDPEAGAEVVKWPGMRSDEWVRPLGWSPSGELVAAVHGHRDWLETASIQVLRADGVDVVTEFEPIDVLENSDGGFQSVSVATDLADVDPVDFAAPRWPLHPEAKILIGAASLGVAAFVVHLLLRRRRQLATDPSRPMEIRWVQR